MTPDGKLSYAETYYDSRGNVLLKSRPHFAGTDAYGTLTQLDPLGRVSSITYEGKITLDSTTGLLATVTSSIGSSTFTYANFTTTETRPSVSYAPEAGVAYSRSGSVATTRNSLGTVTQVVESGSTTQTNQPAESLSATISYSYDGFGALETITDPINAVTKYTVDAYGHRTDAQDPNRGEWKFEYDPLGEMTKQTDANSVVTSFGYDLLGRTTSRTINGSLTTTWNYDSAVGKGIGQLASISSFGSVSDAFEYDSFERLSKSTRTIGATAYVSTYGYDSFDRLKTIAYADSGFTERRVYSGYGHWVALRNDTTSGRFWVGTKYEADGRVDTIQYGNGLTTQRVYRPEMGGVLDSVQTGTTASPTNAQNLQYFYEPGRIGSVYQRFDFNHGVAEGFTYDSLTRLRTTYLGTASTSSTAITGTTTSQYTYDLAGNLLTKTGVGTYNYFPKTQWGTGYPAHAIKSINSGSQYVYDSDGNLTSADGLSTSWTPFNQPDTISRAGATSSSFKYGPDLLRVQQIHGSETDDYVTSSHEHRFGNGSDKYVHYLVGPFGRMGQVTYTGGQCVDVEYFHHDHLGSVDTITDLNGTPTVQSYDPWGERRSATTWQSGFVSSPERRGFTDHEELDDLKLVDMNGRIYDPHLGRFLSVDPVYDRMYETQGVNAYSYVRNNPISYTDPTGLADGGPASEPPVQLPTFTVTDSWRTGGLSYASSLNFPTFGNGFPGVRTPAMPFTPGVNQSFNNGALTVCSSNWFMPSSDPVKPEHPWWWSLNSDYRPGPTDEQIREQYYLSIARFEQLVGDYGEAGAWLRSLPVLDIGADIHDFYAGQTTSGRVYSPGEWGLKGVSTALFAAAVYGEVSAKIPITSTDGYLFGAKLNIKAPFDIPVQRFGRMNLGRADFWGLRIGKGEIANRLLNAIKVEWNPLTNYTEGIIPKGTPINVGIVGPQGLRYPGGSIQFTVPSRLVEQQSSTYINRK